MHLSCFLPVLADMNFPTHSLCMGEGRPKEYRADGVSISTLLPAILQLMPLDWYHKWQMAVMEMTPEDQKKSGSNLAPVVEIYRDVANKCEGVTDKSVIIQPIERFAFYEYCKSTFAIIQTGDTTPYANVILTRG
ncbi:hypothetical protein HAZT_HAZT003588, partial [Hyalella azteca]